jgi:hypothetical protein
MRMGETLSAVPILKAASLKSGAAVKLDWTPTTDARVTGYVLMRGETPDKMKALAELPSNAATYTDATTGAYRAYVYGLALKLKPGAPGGALALPSSFLPVRAINTTPPSAPRGLSAVRNAKGQVTLTWTASPETDLQGYLVFRSEKPDTELRHNSALTGTVIQGTRYVSPLDAMRGAKFYYRVQALNTTGVPSKPSQAVMVQLPEGRPAAALLNYASPGDSKVDLGWSYPVGSGNRESVPTQVEVFRKNPNGELVLIARLPGSTRTFTDTHVVPAYVYAYTVAMLDAVGKRSVASNIIAAQLKYLPVIGALGGLKARKDGGAVVLGWTAAPEATSYFVYRLLDDAPTLLATVRTTRYRDPAPPAKATYRVVPRALNGTQGTGAEVNAP